MVKLGKSIPSPHSSLSPSKVIDRVWKVVSGLVMNVGGGTKFLDVVGRMELSWGLGWGVDNSDIVVIALDGVIVVNGFFVIPDGDVVGELLTVAVSGLELELRVGLA